MHTLSTLKQKILEHEGISPECVGIGSHLKINSLCIYDENTLVGATEIPHGSTVEFVFVCSIKIFIKYQTLQITNVVIPLYVSLSYTVGKVRMLHK